MSGTTVSDDDCKTVDDALRVIQRLEECAAMALKMGRTGAVLDNEREIKRIKTRWGIK